MDDKVFNKLLEMVYFICSQFNKNQSQLSRTKIIKILWFSDTTYCAKTGNSISGLEYYKKYAHGPYIPQIKNIEDKLENDGLVSIQSKALHEHNQTIYSLRKPFKASNILNHKEIKVLSEWSDLLKKETAAGVSEASHEEWWNDFEMYADIPVWMRIPVESKRLNTNDQKALIQNLGL